MAAEMPSRRAALLVVIACNLLWAGSYVSGKTALDEVPFVTLNALRFGIAAVILAPIVWRGRHLLPRDRGGRLRLLAIALFGFCGNKALEFLGLSMTTATDTALLITAESLVTLLLAVLILREHLQRRTALALAMGGSGCTCWSRGAWWRRTCSAADRASATASWWRHWCSSRWPRWRARD
jgi:drug/metabolite transporter (DMT)-like permease